MMTLLLPKWVGILELENDLVVGVGTLSMLWFRFAHSRSCWHAQSTWGCAQLWHSLSCAIRVAIILSVLPWSKVNNTSEHMFHSWTYFLPHATSKPISQNLSSPHTPQTCSLIGETVAWHCPLVGFRGSSRFSGRFGQDTAFSLFSGAKDKHARYTAALVLISAQFWQWSASCLTISNGAARHRMWSERAPSKPFATVREPHTKTLWKL